ncbi:hypothetical protein D4S03_01290 [bacterium]|nr:MAG: hypothetical protein D4S03_01290 [bacterium]
MAKYRLTNEALKDLLPGSPSRSSFQRTEQSSGPLALIEDTKNENYHRMSMKMKFKILISPLIGLCLFLLLLQCCKKEEDTNQFNGKTTAIFNPGKTYGSLTDQDGNIYRTITIGSQTWMAENLRTTTYRNSDAIPLVTDSTAWKNLSTGAYCNYQNTNNIDTIATYGRLYNWAAVTDNHKIAPFGWHVPTHDELNVVIYNNINEC